MAQYKFDERLPTLPSDLIILAVNDLLACEQSLDYRINMEDWFHRVTTSDAEKGVCFVCFAGAVMAQRGNIPSDSTDVAPSKFARSRADMHDVMRLSALDRFRKGKVWVALGILDMRDGLDFADVPERHDIAEYKDNPHVFKIQMVEIAEQLKRIGL